MAALIADISDIAVLESVAEALEAELEHTKVAFAERKDAGVLEIAAQVSASPESAELLRLSAEARKALAVWRETRCSGWDGCTGVDLVARMGCRCWESGYRTDDGNKNWDVYLVRDARVDAAHVAVRAVREAFAAPLMAELEAGERTVQALEEAVEKARSAVQDCKDAKERHFYETASIAVLEERLTKWIGELDGYKAKALELLVWMLGGEYRHGAECHCGDPNECWCSEEVDASESVRARKPNAEALAHFVPLYEEALEAEDA